MTRIKVYGLQLVADPEERKRLQKEISALKKHLFPFLDEIFIQDPTPRIILRKNLTLEFSAKITPELKEKIFANPNSTYPLTKPIQYHRNISLLCSVMSPQSLDSLILEHQSLQLSDTIDFDRFNRYDITHHSTVIEGSSLSENETRLLLQEGITPKGKPLQDSLMVKDHATALQYCLREAKKYQPVTEGLIKSINALVMKNTGSVYNTALGQVDATKGEYRKGNVSAGGYYFPAYDKVAKETLKLVDKIQAEMKDIAMNNQVKLNLSFAAHYNLVSIHPFYDGNGRTSRLLMNYVQKYFNLPLAIVYKEDKNDYITALQEARKEENIHPFLMFMYEQYRKLLTSQIEEYKALQNNEGNKHKGFRLLF